MSLEIERIEDIYDIGEWISEGRFGVVNRVIHKLDMQEYAMKQIPLPSAERKRANTLKLVSALYNLKHKHIVAFHLPFHVWKDNKNFACKFKKFAP